MEFAEYPKMLVKGDQERVVVDATDEEAARTDGFEFKGVDSLPAVKAIVAAAVIKPYEPYPKMLYRGGDYVIVEDEIAEAEAAADGFAFKGSEPAPVVDPLDHDHDGKKGGSVPNQEREDLKAALADLNVSHAKNASIETLRRLLDEATAPPVVEPVVETEAEAAAATDGEPAAEATEA